MVLLALLRKKERKQEKKKEKEEGKMKRITSIAGAALVIGIFVSNITIIQSAQAWIDPDPQPRAPKAPAVISGENVYIVWWTDQGTVNANGEVMFRASTDGGATFSDKINLSNTTDADSIDAEIAAEGENVIVTWWETGNQTGTTSDNTPVARISTDAGETFGPMLTLATNGTISSTEEGGETVEEEAVGGEEVAE